MRVVRFFAIIAVIAALVFAAWRGLREPQTDTETVAPALIAKENLPDTASAAALSELPVEVIRSALADVCSTDTAASDNEDLTEKEFQERMIDLSQLLLSLSERLSGSTSAEHLHLAALLADNSIARIELLERAIARSPNDAFLLWRAVQICSVVDVPAACSLSSRERRLIAVDGQNSESWLRIAANRYNVGESDAALDAMRHAATSAETRIYWTETIEMIERGLAAAGSDYTFPERAAMAVGIAATKLPDFGVFTRMCKEQSLLSADWAHTCLAYGELAENQGKTEIGVAVGQSIQALALEALGEFEKAAEVEQRRQSRSEERTRSMSIETQRLIFSNSTFFYAYLTAIRSMGEFEAQRDVAGEIKRLREQQTEFACDPK